MKIIRRKKQKRKNTTFTHTFTSMSAMVIKLWQLEAINIERKNEDECDEKWYEKGKKVCSSVFVCVASELVRSRKMREIFSIDTANHCQVLLLLLLLWLLLFILRHGMCKRAFQFDTYAILFGACLLFSIIPIYCFLTVTNMGNVNKQSMCPSQEPSVSGRGSAGKGSHRMQRTKDCTKKMYKKRIKRLRGKYARVSHICVCMHWIEEYDEIRNEKLINQKNAGA